MENKKARRIVSILLVVMCALISLQGCGFLSRWHTPTEEKGISIGFQYENRKGPLITAIKSDKKVFDIDDVTLDFYYGGLTREFLGCNSVGFYFASGKTNLVFNTHVDDYKNIDSCYFIKEMTIDDYVSGPFDIEQRWGPKKKDEKDNVYFHFVDTWTIPKEMFTEEFGIFAFFIAHIVLIEDGNTKYKLDFGSRACGQRLYYTKTEDGYIELSTRR